MNPQRVTFSPGEFAALFGKSQTWGYRQIYAGKVKTITEYGRILIPASEVEHILGSASRYEGKAKTKSDFQQLGSALQVAWKTFLRKRRVANVAATKTPRRIEGAVSNGAGVVAARRAALSRLGRKG